MLLTLFAALSLTSASLVVSPAAEILYDKGGRPVIATQINNSGPYFMVVDTAAQTSLLVGKMSEILKLTPIDSGLTINGATGQSAARMFPIESFSSPLFSVNKVGLLELSNPGLTNAAGIVGMEMFNSQVLVFDLQNRQLKTTTSEQLGKEFVEVKGSVSPGELITAIISINGLELPALIDSGASSTIANAAALKKLGWQNDDPRLIDDGEIRGASGADKIKTAKIDKLTIGPVTFSDIPVRFTQHDGEEQAHVILGSDLLNHLMGYALDFSRGKFFLLMPVKNALPD